MGFSIWPSIIGKNRQGKLNNINVLKETLITVGYNPGEVDFMIKSSSNGKKLPKLDDKELHELEASLEAQLRMARQCLELVREAN
ncbi:MAG: hypothetical protein VB084_05920 [Syntrophomonadaceae bacterium]|nr:hypothetical protein [Syntrophomonadaceae bacterium]